MSDDGIIGPGMPYWHLYGPLIEELRAENKRLRAALEEIIKWDDYAHTAKVARAALEETK